MSSGSRTSSFGTGRREGHDASEFYRRFPSPILSDDQTVNWTNELAESLAPGSMFCRSATDMAELPDNSVSLVVTSPPYFVGKDYELAVADNPQADTVPATYLDYLEMLRSVFAECRRVLEPGGRIAVNVANLGRKPYRSLSADVISILQDDLGLLLRGEVVWQKAKASGGSCAWGSFARASNPVLRDTTERIVVAAKGSFSRAIPVAGRAKLGLPHESTISNDEFIDATLDVWQLDAESARRVGHPAPFPVDLPRRLIELYTYVGDLVLDPFAGSGTTLVAAAVTSRVGVGYDLDPAYCELTEQRLAAVTGDPSVPPLPGLAPGSADDGYRAARDLGRNAKNIASEHLTAAGFTVEKAKPLRRLGVQFDLVAAAPDGRRFNVAIGGGFWATKPGLSRTDLVWRLLAQAAVLHAATGDRLLVLTPARPKPTSDAGKALAQLEGEAIDVIELFDADDAARLAHLAAG